MKDAIGKVKGEKDEGEKRNLQQDATLLKFIKKIYVAKERSQWLRVLAALGEDLGSIPSPQMAAHDHRQLQFQKVWCSLLASVSSACMWYPCIHVGRHSYT